MPLSAGTRLGPYEILAPIGAGGMGEVYRARDIKLDRQVAIKILPDAVAQDPDRMARFEREAKALASLKSFRDGHVRRSKHFSGSAVYHAISEKVSRATIFSRSSWTSVAV